RAPLPFALPFADHAPPDAVGGEAEIDAPLLQPEDPLLDQDPADPPVDLGVPSAGFELEVRKVGASVLVELEVELRMDDLDLLDVHHLAAQLAQRGIEAHQVDAG